MDLKNHLYRTTDLKAAVKFRDFADDMAAKVFLRTFVRRYEVMTLPSLSFLDPHQREGIKWILGRSRSYLAHAPGAGKTAQAIVASLLVPVFPEGINVFIVPPGLTKNWEREIYKWTEFCDCFPSVGILPDSEHKDEMAWRAQYLIIPDSMLAKTWVYDKLKSLQIRFLAVDEASRFKDSLSERSIALFGGRTKKRSYSGLYQNTRHTVLLDGSPMLNRPIELWGPTFALNPEAIDCMSRDDFGYRYCGPTIDDRGVWHYKHSSNEDELKKKLQKDFMHVVLEKDLSHPERRRKIIFMPKGAAGTSRTVGWERSHLSKIKLSDLDENMSQGTIAEIRNELGKTKVKWTARYIQDILDNTNESILVFGWHIDFLMMLETWFKDAVAIRGGISQRSRELFIKKFQRKESRLLIGNIAAMGRGYNLQAADRVIFGEFSWNRRIKYSM